MRYLEFPGTDPAFNLAAEQYVFEELAQAEDYFILWQNENALIVGKNQNTAAEINQAFVDEQGIKVVRRLSGGGAVYHDLGNLNFTFIVGSSESDELDLHLFCVPVVEALASLGIEARIEGRNDMTIGGKKFSGNAQYRKEGRIMHHGTILFNSDLTVLSQALKVSDQKLQTKGIRSVASRVTNVSEHLTSPLTIEEFKAVLVQQVAATTPLAPAQLTQSQLSAIQRLQKARYDTWEWNYGRSPQYSVQRSGWVEGCGSIEAFLEVSGGRIESLRIYGDFFGRQELHTLEEQLTNVYLEQHALENALAGIQVEHCISKLTNKQLIDILIG